MLDALFPDLLADPDFVRDEIETDHPPEATFANTVERPDLSKRTALS